MKAKLSKLLRRAVCAAPAVMGVTARTRARTHRGSDGTTARTARRRGKGGRGQAHEPREDGRAHRAARTQRDAGARPPARPDFRARRMIMRIMFERCAKAHERAEPITGAFQPVMRGQT